MTNHKGLICVVDHKTFCQEGFCTDCELARQQKATWVKKRCVICHREFEYISNGIYEPQTCVDIDCNLKYNHKKLKQ